MMSVTMWNDLHDLQKKMCAINERIDRLETIISEKLASRDEPKFISAPEPSSLPHSTIEEHEEENDADEEAVFQMQHHDPLTLDVDDDDKDDGKESSPAAAEEEATPSPPSEESQAPLISPEAEAFMKKFSRVPIFQRKGSEWSKDGCHMEIHKFQVRDGTTRKLGWCQIMVTTSSKDLVEVIDAPNDRIIIRKHPRLE